MDAMDLIYLGTSLAATAGAVFGFTALVGQGPRGALLLLAALLFSWGVALPYVAYDSDLGTVSREFDLLSTVLFLGGAIGGIFGVGDLLQANSRRRYPLAEWLLRQPMLWGGIACGIFYLWIGDGTIESSLLYRYFASHPILEITTVLFFFAAAELTMRCGRLVAEHRRLDQVSLDSRVDSGEPASQAEALLARLEEVPEAARETYLVRRLREALQYVRRKDSAEGLDAHLRHLEELDLATMNAAYATIRIIIWAIPILGFLGTVVGITMAIANMSPESLEQSMPEVISGLGVAFDTTALALALVMALMFGKSIVEKVEERLLSQVDARVSQALVGRFEEVGGGSDPNVASIRRMSEEVLTAVEKMAHRQAQLWKATIDESHLHWSEIAKDASRTVRDSLASTLKSNLDQHAESLNRGVQLHASRLSESASQHAEVLAQSAKDSAAHLHDGLEKLGELLVESLHQHGQVMTASERELAEENRRHLSEVEAALGEAMVVAADRQENLIRQSEQLLTQMQVALIEAAGATVEHQEQLVRQSDVLLRVVDATGQIKELETTLNENLAAIRRSADFSGLVHQISSAVQAIAERDDARPVVNHSVMIEPGHTSPYAA